MGAHWSFWVWVPNFQLQPQFFVLFPTFIDFFFGSTHKQIRIFTSATSRESRLMVMVMQFASMTSPWKPHLAMSTTVRFSIGQLLGMDDTIGDLLAGDLQAQFAVAYDGSDWCKTSRVCGSKKSHVGMLESQIGCFFGKSRILSSHIEHNFHPWKQKWSSRRLESVFSPHHCVGFLFFAWIPPLSTGFRIPPRRLTIISHLSSHLSHHTTTHHSSTSHTSLITSLITSHSSHHNSSQLHFSHLTYHISHHISLITPQLITAPLLTSHSSHQCGRRSTQSLLAELRRVWPPLGPRLAFVWQAQYTEPPGGAAARVAAAWAAAGFHVATQSLCGARGRRLGRAWLSCGRRSTHSPLGGAARVAAAGFHLISSYLILSHLISSYLISLSLARLGGEPHIQNLKLSYKSPAGVAAVSGSVCAIMTISARFGAQYVFLGFSWSCMFRMDISY